MERFRKDGKWWRFLGTDCFMIGTFELGIDNKQFKNLMISHEMWPLKFMYPKSSRGIRPHAPPFASLTKKGQPISKTPAQLIH